MAKPTLPVTLSVGDTTGEIGTVDIPLLPGPVTRGPSGVAFVTFNVDHAAFRRNLADVLRATADQLEKGATDDGD